MKFLIRLLACVLGLAAASCSAQSNPTFTGTVTFNNSLFAGSAIFPPAMLGLGVPSSTTVLYGDGRWRPVSGGGGGGSNTYNPYVAATNGVQQLRVGTGWASNPLDTYLGSIGASTTIVLGINGSKVGRINISGLNEINIGSVTPGTGQFTTLRATGLDSTPIGAVTPAAGTFTALSATSGLITGVSVKGLPTPTAGTDAATKAYVDALAGGLVPKTAVRVATTANIASLTAVTVVDGVTLANLDRVLVKNQSAPAANGIYSYTLATTTLARATDADTAAELALNQYYFITAGTANANTGWVISTAPTTLGVDPVQFSQFSASASYTAGTGLQLSGSQFSLDSTIAMLRAQNLADVANVATARTNLGLGTLALQAASSVAITGGTINGATIGATTPSTGRFSSGVVTSASVGATTLNIDNTSVGGHVYQLYSLGSGSAHPGYFGLGDGTSGLNPILIDTNARTTLVALEGTPIGATTPSTGVFTTATARVLVGSTVGLATSAELSLAGDTGQFKQTLLKTGGAIRWSYGSNSTAESGANAGSDFVMARWNDAGGYIQDVFGITRATGNVTWYEHPNFFRYNSIGGTSTVSLDVPNDSSATVGVPQWSPALHFKGDTWRTGSGTRIGAHWKMEIQTPSAAAGSNNLVFSSDLSDTPSYTARMTMTNAGLTYVGGISEKNVFNVRTYGAAGDGATTDTTAISTAIAAAKAVNGTVYFPAGTYLTGAITITGATGLTLRGDGMGVSVIKTTSPSQVLNVSSSHHVNVYGLTFNGSCTTRTAGQQGVVFDAVQSRFTDNEIVNAGEYAFFAGSGGTQIYDLTVSRNVVRACFADGINFQYVTRSLIADNIVDGSDDDCIALGYNGSGVTSFVNVVGNYCRARTDLGTTWGRGILVERATDCLVEGNLVDTIKQTGIFVNGAGGRAYRNRIVGNTVTNASTLSGSSIAAYQTTDCTFEGNHLFNQAGGGSMFDIADWQNLKILGGTIVQNLNVFTRGIHADEGGGWAASWDNLTIKGVAIDMLGAATNNCVYLNPTAGFTMNTLVVDGVIGRQVVGGDYITVGTARIGTLAKLVNNTTLTAGRTVSSGGILALANNN